MNTAYEYITFAGNSGFLWQVFNAIATLMGSGGFESLIMATTMLGFIFVVGVGAFKLDLKPFSMWFFGLVFIWYGFMIPKVNVMIVDRTSTQAPMVVANVPLGFAMPASYVSQIGDYLTTNMESLFSLPDDLKYSENGMLFGGQLYQTIYKSSLEDRVLQSDWAAFMNNCTLYDIVLYNLISPRELRESINLMETLGNTNQALFVNISKGTAVTNAMGLPSMEYTNEKETMYCNVAYNQLKQRTEMDTRGQMFKLAKITDKTGDNTNLTSQYNKFLGGLDATYTTFLGGVSSNAMEGVMQQTMMNILKEGEIQNATNNGNSERLQSALAAAQAEKATLLSMQTGGMSAATMLPMIKNIIEGVIISLFPIVILCAVLALGAMWKVIQAYFLALIWIQLWPPLFAVMNLAMTAQTRNNVAGLINQSSGDVGVSLANSAEILKAFAAMENVASGMMWSIPVIAAAIVQGMKSLAGASLMGMAKGGESASSSAAGAISSGNINIGNVQSGNQNSNKRDTSQSYNSGTATFNSGSMGNMTFTPGAQNAAQFQNNPYTGMTQKQISSSFNQMAAKANTEAQTSTATAQQSYASANTQMFQKMATAGVGSTFTNSMMSNMTDSDRKTATDVLQAAEQISQTHGISKAQAVESVLSGSVSSSASLEGGFTILGQGVKVNGTTTASTTKSNRSSEALKQDVAKAHSALKQSGFSLNADQVKSMANTDAYQQQLQSGDSQTQSIAKTISQGDQATKSAADSYARSKSYSETASRMSQTGESLIANEKQSLDNFLANSGSTLNETQNNPTASIAAASDAINFGSSVPAAPTDPTRNTTGATHARNVAGINKDMPTVDGSIGKEIDSGKGNLTQQGESLNSEVGRKIENAKNGNNNAQDVLDQNVANRASNRSGWHNLQDNQDAWRVTNALGGEPPGSKGWAPSSNAPSSAASSGASEDQGSKKPNPPTHGPVSKGGTGFPSQVSNKVGRKWENLAKGRTLTDLAKVIAMGEGSYTSVNFPQINGEKGNRNGNMDLKNMTVEQIMNLQGNKKLFAVGRYQMIPTTFAEGVKKLGISKNAKFTPELQDKMYREYLIPKAGGGAVARYLKGNGSLQDAVIGMAMEWRSIADPTTGKTYADKGANGNKATIPAFVIAGILENIKNNQK